MKPKQIPNYLLSNRKRLGLSQADVAYLLGLQASDVCRHELFRREPHVTNALGYEVIYKRSMSEIFSGLYQRAEQEIAKRAKALADKAAADKPTKRNTRRREVLADLANSSANN